MVQPLWSINSMVSYIVKHSFNSGVKKNPCHTPGCTYTAIPSLTIANGKQPNIH